MVSGRSGFTLVETLVALAISGILMVMVATTFLVQNTFYANILQRGRLQDNARTVAEVVGSDLRSLMSDGVVVADSARLVVRVPLALGTVCAVAGSSKSVHLVGGEDALDSSIARRVALRSSGGAWTYYTETWESLKIDDSGAVACASNGTDTTGISNEFATLELGAAGSFGDVFMVYRETEFRIQPSVLDPAATALYRGPNGGTLVELATPLSPEAHFAYWKPGGTGWKVRFSSGLTEIQRVRVFARARGPAEAASEVDMEFDLVVDVPLRNAL